MARAPKKAPATSKPKPKQKASKAIVAKEDIEIDTQLDNPAIRNGCRPTQTANWFKPGQSGNPTGRPKQDRTLKALAREHTETAIRRLADIVRDDKASPSAQVAAASALLDRGWGKPLQQLEIGEAGAFSDMDEKALDAFIIDAVAQLKRDDGRYVQ